MTMTRKDIAQILAILGAAYPRQVLNAAQLKLAITVWLDILGDIPLDQIHLAVKAHCSNSKWFPAVAEIRQAALDLGETEADRITAGDAWGEVTRAFGRTRWGELPDFSHPRIMQAVIAIGGWQNLCASNIDAATADRARFIQAFETYERREHTDRRMLPAVRECVGRRRALTDGGTAPQLTEGTERVDGALKQLAAGMTR